MPVGWGSLYLCVGIYADTRIPFHMCAHMVLSRMRPMCTTKRICKVWTTASREGKGNDVERGNGNKPTYALFTTPKGFGSVMLPHFMPPHTCASTFTCVHACVDSSGI